MSAPDRTQAGNRVVMWRERDEFAYRMGKDSGRFGDQAVDDQALEWFEAGYNVAVVRIEYTRRHPAPPADIDTKGD